MVDGPARAAPIPQKKLATNCSANEIYSLFSTDIFLLKQVIKETVLKW